MIALFFVLIAVTVIVALGTAAFVVIVINIQIVDRSKQLMREPRNVLDAATRRLLGTRGHSSDLRQKKES